MLVCVFVLCVLQDSQVDQHFADETFPVENKSICLSICLSIYLSISWHSNVINRWGRL